MAFAIRGIKVKITLAIAASVMVTVVLLTAATNYLIALSFNLSLQERSAETAKILTQAIELQTRQMAVHIELLTQNAQFQQDCSFEAWDNVNESLTKARTSALASAALLLNLKNDPVGESSSEDVSARLLRDSIARGLAREQQKTVSTIETLGGKLMLVSASPLTYFNQTVGAVLVGTLVSDRVLAKLKESSGAELLLVRDGKITASTFHPDNPTAVSGVESLFATSASGVVAVPGLSDHGRPLYAWTMPLRAAGSLQSALVFGLSTETVVAIKRQINRSALALAVIIILLTSSIGFIIARRISDPIVEIEHSFREIASSGDLSRRIVKGYTDEVGRMADSFNQMLVQIEQLHGRVVVAEQRMRNELQMASAVQEMLFPASAVDGARCTFASLARTSTEMGGDWCTIIHLPTHHTTTVIVADVTGHGAPAALVAAILHGFFSSVRPMIAQTDENSWGKVFNDLLHSLNEVIIAATRRSLVLSLVVLTFDHQKLTAQYVNAGHPPPLLVRTVAGIPEITVLPAPPSSLIGDSDNPSFHIGKVQLAPDQIVVLFSDGLVECVNRADEQYGLKRLRQLLTRNSHLDARALRDTIFGAVSAFMEDVPAGDDITMVVGRVSR